jgi:hypothetical protein
MEEIAQFRQIFFHKLINNSQNVRFLLNNVPFLFCISSGAFYWASQIGFKFCKFYFIKTSFILGELVYLIKQVFRLC